MDKKRELELKEKALAEMNEKIESHVSSWSDLYAIFHAKMAAFHADANRHTVDDAMLTMYAFILSLEDMPEEGDALRIAKHMTRIMIMEPERLGAQVTVIDTEDQERAKRVLAAMGMMLQQGEAKPTPQDEEEEPAAGSKHLH